MNRFKQNRDGIAAVEFALMAPIFLLLLFGVVDITRYILIVQKVEKLAHSVANVTAQSTTVTQATLNQVFAAGSDIMRPYTMGANGRIIVTSLYRAAGAAHATVNWRVEGGGTLSVSSTLGALGGTPTMPSPFAFAERENLIAAEVYYRFSPVLDNPWFGEATIYRAAFYAPRFGALTTAPG